MDKKETHKKGITLIALVITIIVLLILAGITIALTIGQRGILIRAEEAGKNYQEAAKREEEDLVNFMEEANNIIEGINTPIGDIYTMIDGVPVPKGFKHIENTGTTENPGFVIKDISIDSEGNLTSTNGNEFVWVPCSEDKVNGSVKYERYAFSKSGWDVAQTKNETTGEIEWAAYGMQYSFTEAMPNVELNSIKQYGGFYIGRYEVGIEGYEGDVKTSNTNGEKEWTGYTNGTAVVQEGKKVWNYITRDKAKKVAEGMYVDNDAVISRLCSSYAWDTTLQWIETKCQGYATNSIGGNYSGGIKDTGKGSTAVNNIYDMGGNVCEWTTEDCKGGNFPCTHRGGNFGNNASSFPAGIRGCDSETGANSSIGFRQALYIQ